MLKLLGQRTDLPNRFIKWHRAVGRIVPSAHPARNDDEAILAKLKNDRRPDGTAELGSLLQHDLSIPLQVIRQQQIHSKVNAQITLNIQPEEASHLRKESHGATSALDACTAASAHCRMWEPDGRMGSRSAELAVFSRLSANSMIKAPVENRISLPCDALLMVDWLDPTAFAIAFCERPTEPSLAKASGIFILHDPIHLCIDKHTQTNRASQYNLSSSYKG
ncbi:TPA: hypothetical protein L5P60_006687 [Pseudomonas aeruginosa]|uniref:hypothetical protein n=2 Tax=Pseudomonas aeruginosa TaxID=287 RepID=UPI003D004630|nr:hypothetical protein [Pseudomonas aeruginosa]